MDIKEIITKHLKDNKFDGLFYPSECACLVEDLMPCGEPHIECEAGYKSTCKKCDNSVCEMGEESDYCISRVKEQTNDRD